ncbi:hypothetical protein [Streptomyces cacaoi]|uniref:hypothetical protein n=1 Tax=Streptomyces cacaoi TaxID=1898 RepID=UPI0026147FF1|nr:hypothetical protein [Streptomyces cacaoi]
MTDQTTTDGTPELSGAALARVALQQARLAAKNTSGEARAPRRRRATAKKRNGREPAGIAAVLQGLMADRAWDIPAAGGTVLDRWPDIAAAVARSFPTTSRPSPSPRRPASWTCAPTPRPTPPSSA